MDRVFEDINGQQVKLTNIAVADDKTDKTDMKILCITNKHENIQS